MSESSDIRSLVEKHSAFLVGQIRVVTEYEKLNTAGIRRGIVFVLAAWSSPAILGFRRFVQALRAVDLTTLELVVVDTDILPDGSFLRELANLGVGIGGIGEVLWIQEGKVVAMAVSSKAGVEPLIVQHTIALLD